MVEYTFPPHYPRDCPPKPHKEICGTYFKVVKNTNKSDPDHFKSQYELGEMTKLEATEACGRRSVSVLASREEAVVLSQQYPKKGKFIAQIVLNNGCGVVHHTPVSIWQSHHDWWIPIGIDGRTYCMDIKEIIP